MKYSATFLIKTWSCTNCQNFNKFFWLQGGAPGGGALWSFFKNYVQNQNKESKFAKFGFYTNCKLLKKKYFSLGSFPRVPIVMTLNLYCQLDTDKLLDLHDISYYTVW